MTETRRAIIMSIGVALLWAGLATEGQAYASPSQDAKLETWATAVGQIHSHILCANCSQPELRAMLLPPARLSSAWQTQLGHSVSPIPPQNAAQQYPSVWPKSGDPLLKILADPQHVFKRTTLSRVLREFLPDANGRLVVWAW